MAVPDQRCTTRALIGAAFGYTLPTLAPHRIRDTPHRQQPRVSPIALPTHVSIEMIVWIWSDAAATKPS